MSKNERNYNLYLADIKDCIKKIEQYTKNLTFEKFKNNEMIIDAVVRNIEIIGEASANIPVKIKAQYPQLPWSKIIGMRNKVVHEYFGVDVEILWGTIQKRIPELKREIGRVKKLF